MLSSDLISYQYLHRLTTINERSFFVVLWLYVMFVDLPVFSRRSLLLHIKSSKLRCVVCVLSMGTVTKISNRLTGLWFVAVTVTENL